MSASDTLPGDYGLGETVKNGPERRIWRTLSVAPDPHAPGLFYAVQELAGEWKKEVPQRPVNDGYIGVRWWPHPVGNAPVTRVLYCELDEFGVMRNLNKDASQGRTKSE